MDRRNLFIKAYCYVSGAMVALASVGIVGYHVGQLMAIKDAEAAILTSDPTLLTKVVVLINSMRDQLTLLEEQTKEQRKALDAIGEAGRIAVPFVNGLKFMKRLREGAGCLLLGADDLQRAMPGLDFSEADLGSICGARDFYKKGLFLNPEQFKDLSVRDQERLILRVQARRSNVASESVLRALGTATTAVDANREYNASIEDHKKAGDESTDQNERFAIIVSGQTLIAEGISQTNQLLTQLLKLQASMSANQVGVVNGSLSDKTTNLNETKEDGS